MKSYEAMFILKPDLNKDKMQELFTQINETFTKNKAKVSNTNIWAEKRKLTFTIKRYKEGTYYLVNFDSNPEEISGINQDYRLNENILRVLITRAQKEK